ncbi:MAG: Asp23/Gls24 family envelope stress response protein [Clostridia bacterium]|nr:Asp23/Gls24 family envelope stress response protein [Clostridia bacterium]
MATKKDNLPLTVDNDTEQTSSITYANEVVATIAGVAAGEVEGIAGMCNVSGGILSKKANNVTRGVKVEIGTEEASVDVYLNVEYGTPIQKAAQDVQENIRKSIESMTGLHVVRVDVHVQGVSFEKENNTLTAGREKAVLEAGTPAPKAEAKAEKPAEEQPAEETQTEA